jgi:outer membrane protein, multidrug efflux system
MRTAAVDRSVPSRKDGQSLRHCSSSRRVEQQENFISVLVGGFPGAVTRGRDLTTQPQAPDVPAGLPSSLLERRPDIQGAEQELVATNAEIGVARAAYFPSITLTGTGGVQSTALGALFSSGAGAWSAIAGLTQPLFTAGRTRSQVALAEARRTEAALSYERIVKQAFLEVSDALVGYRKARDFREQQELLFAAAQDGRRLADIRYRGGARSYLEVLDSETRLFNAELSLADARLSELTDFVELYRALGGVGSPKHVLRATCYTRITCYVLQVLRVTRATRDVLSATCYVAAMKGSRGSDGSAHRSFGTSGAQPGLAGS